MYQAWCIFSVQRLTKKWNKGVRRQHHRLSNSDYYAFMWFFCVIFLCLWIDKVLLSCCCCCSVWTLSMWSRDGMRDKMHDCRKMTFVSFLCKSLPSDITNLVAKFTKWFFTCRLLHCTLDAFDASFQFCLERKLDGWVFWSLNWFLQLLPNDLFLEWVHRRSIAFGVRYKTPEYGLLMLDTGQSRVIQACGYSLHSEKCTNTRSITSVFMYPLWRQ